MNLSPFVLLVHGLYSNVSVKLYFKIGHTLISFAVSFNIFFRSQKLKIIIFFMKLYNRLGQFQIIYLFDERRSTKKLIGCIENSLTPT